MINKALKYLDDPVNVKEDPSHPLASNTEFKPNVKIFFHGTQKLTFKEEDSWPPKNKMHS